MFIVSLTYTKPLEEVDTYIEVHIEYLKEQYEKGNFIASGRKVPRIGGVILSKLTSKKELEKVLVQDPFHKANIATYEIIEFISSMTAKEFDNLKD